MAGMPHSAAQAQSFRPRPHAELRVSDDDRERVVEHVKTAYAQGRFDKDEFDDRVDRAMTAHTHSDLMPIMEELYGRYPGAAPHRAPVPAAVVPYPPAAGPCPQAGTSGDRLGAGAAHLLSLIGVPVLGPLIIMLTAGQTSPFVRMHAVEALNFQLTAIGAMILLSITLVGVILLPVVFIAGLVLALVAGVKAMDGRPYRYPLTVRAIK